MKQGRKIDQIFVKTEILSRVANITCSLPSQWTIRVVSNQIFSTSHGEVHSDFVQSAVYINFSSES